MRICGFTLFFMTTSRPHLFGLLAGLALAAGLCFASVTFTRAWTRISEDQVINVTGSARKDVRSDLAIWRAGFSSEAATLPEAHARSQADLARVTTFLQAANQHDFIVKPVQVSELYERIKTDQGEISRHAGYRIRQNLEIRSAEVDALPKLASDAVRLLENGITLASEGMDFRVTATPPPSKKPSPPPSPPPSPCAKNPDSSRRWSALSLTRWFVRIPTASPHPCSSSCSFTGFSCSPAATGVAVSGYLKVRPS